MVQNGTILQKKNTFLIFLKCVLSTIGILNNLFRLQITPENFNVPS